MKHLQEQAAGQKRLGTAPMALLIENLPANTPASGTVTFTIAPIAGQALDMAAGVYTFPNGTLTGQALDSTKQTSTATFSFSGTPTNGLLNLPVAMYYSGSKMGPERKFRMAAAITVGGRSVSANADLTVGLS